MGARGPRKKPTALKVLEGNPGKRKLNRNEPKPSKENVRPPEWLTDGGRAMWDMYSTSLMNCGLLTDPDCIIFGAFCSDADMLAKMYNELKDKEKFIGKSVNKIIANPLLLEVDRVMNRMLAISKRFGLTPSDRAEIFTAATGEVNSNPIVEMIVASKAKG